MEVFVKRLIVLLIITILIAGNVSAQAIREQQNTAPQPRNEQQQRREANPQVRNNQQRNVNPQVRNAPQRESKPVQVEGTLKLEKGFVAVESGDSVFIVPMLNRYIGFISGLKEGAKVSVEGRGFRNAIQPTKVTLDGKTYEFSERNFGPTYGNQQNFNRRHDNCKNHKPVRNSHNHGRKSGHGNSRSSGCCR